MIIDRLFRAALILALLPTAGLAFWLRVTSPTYPAVSGDEAFYGVQAARLLEGRSIASKTASGNVLNLLVLGAEVPLHAALGPSNLVIKIPAIVAGLLAVAATWWCLRRSLDRTTAAIACGLMAVLPVAIIECRVGAEPAWNPLVGVLALGAAFRGHRLLTLLAFLLCYYVHPTYLFGTPVYALVLGARVAEQDGWRWRAFVPRLATCLVVGGAVLGGLAWLTSGRSVLEWTYQTYGFGPMDWRRFAILYERLLMGFCECGPTESPARFDRLFWGTVVAVGVPGTILLAVRREWAQLGLVLGLVISACGLHTVTGPDILRHYFVRYGLFLVPPSVVAMACALRAWMPEGESPGAVWGRRAQLAGIAAFGFAIVYHAKTTFFDNVFPQTCGQERLWTLNTEAVDPKEWVHQLILDDLPHDAPPGVAVLAENWWTHRPLEYLASGDRRLKVASLEHFAPPQREKLIRKHLQAGGYVLGTVGAEVPAQVESLFPTDQLRDWHVYSPPNACLVVYRLRRSGEEARPLAIAVLQPPGTPPLTLTR